MCAKRQLPGATLEPMIDVGPWITTGSSLWKDRKFASMIAAAMAGISVFV